MRILHRYRLALFWFPVKMTNITLKDSFSSPKYYPSSPDFYYILLYPFSAHSVESAYQTTGETTMTKIHVFETAGLGQAPFKFVGYYVDRGRSYTSPEGITVTIGAPGQPTGTCDYCGTSIANCFRIQSADGKTFVVGSECVMKTGDAGLKAEVNKVKAEITREKQDKTIAENWLWVEENRHALSLRPYGKYTLLESIEWFYKNAGRSGKINIIRAAKKAIA